jgi:hypothetical protein
MSFLVLIFFSIIIIIIGILETQRVYILKCPLVHKLATLPPNPQKDQD